MSVKLPTHRTTTHPGEILSEEFLIPMEVSQVRFAEHIGVPTQRINEIVNGKRGITPETAWLFAQALGTSAEFWTNAQSAFDLTSTRDDVRRVNLITVAASKRR